MFSTLRKYFSLYAGETEELGLLQIFKPFYVLLAVFGLFPCSIEFPKEKQDFIVIKCSRNLLSSLFMLIIVYVFLALHLQEINADSENHSYTKDAMPKWNYIIQLVTQLLCCTTSYICAFQNRYLYVSILNEMAHAWSAFPDNRRIILGRLRVKINCVVLGSLTLTHITLLIITYTGAPDVWKLVLITVTFVLPEMIQFALIAFYFIMVVMQVALLKNIECHCRMLNNFNGSFKERVITLSHMRSVYVRVLSVKGQINTVFQAPILLILAQAFHTLVSEPHTAYHGLVFQTNFNFHNMVECSWWTLMQLLKIYALAQSGALLKLQVLKIGQTIYNIPNNNHKDIRLHLEIEHFSTTIKYLDADISIYGMFSLEAPLMYNIIASAALYLVILVQFDMAMGSGASGVASDTPGGDLRLPTSGLKFSIHQLRALNSYVDSLYDDDQKDRMSTEMESAVESMVQRIVDGAGQKDPRFRCCHLIALHRGKKMRSRSLEYLVTLDALPTLNAGNEDCFLQDGPVGFGRVHLSGREADKWEEFLTPSGYLCRDKVLERWVELIARCAHARGGGGSRVLCARAAVRAQPHNYCYLERTSPPQSITDRRLAIVEGAAWVMVRVGAGEAEAKLMLGARVGGCSAAAYSCRVPLTHPLALLHYTAAQQGYYATAVGPPASMSCQDRAATWQLWHPSLEATLDAHFSDLSTVARVAGALNSLLDKMRDGVYQGSVRGVSRYLAQCAVRRRADRCAALAQPVARFFAQTHASHHLLLILDSILSVCERGSTAGYVYPTERAALVRRGARTADWDADAACVRRCLMDLHRLPALEEILLSPSESLEAVLFSRWENLNKESKSPAGTAPNYTRRQLFYLWRVASELVTCKKMVVFENHSTFRANLLQATSHHHESVEQLIHILAIMLDQARDLYLNNVHTRSVGEFDREMSTYRSKKWNKLKDYYDASSACLIDAVRRDPELQRQDLADQLTIMRNVLHWLYKGAKDDKKYLSPVLKPYLDSIFTSSLENSWFLEDFDAKKSEAEFEGLKAYCVGVHDGEVEPCLGLLDAAKRLAWAKALVDFVDRYKHIDFRLVFPTGEGMAVSYPMKLPSRREHSAARELTLSRRDKSEAKLRLARRCVLAAFIGALAGDKQTKVKNVSRHASTDEILASAKTGNYWRNNTKPDVIPSTSVQDLSTIDNLTKAKRQSRRRRPATAYGFPAISITNQSDAKTMRRKYHTLKSLVYTEPVESIIELRRRPRSAGSTVRNKETLSRPSLLETLDFINSVKDALCVEESGASDAEDTSWSLSDEWLVGQTSPLALAAARSGVSALHAALADLVPALLLRRRFTILQELCSWLGESSEGALFALHRLARAARSRSSERVVNPWKLPEAEGVADAPQKYRARPPDYVSEDEAPQPPPLPRRSSKDKQLTKRYSDYLPPKRIQELDNRFTQLELAATDLCITRPSYTGVINPLYDIKIPKDKFSVKRSKSLGRSFSTRKLGLDMNRYNITLGRRGGERTNDVITAITGTTGETGVGYKGNFFHRYNAASVVGDSYKTSKATID